MSDEVCAKPTPVGPSWHSQVQVKEMPKPSAPAQSQPAEVSTFIPGGSIVKPETSAGITHKNALHQQDVHRLMYVLEGTVRTITYSLTMLGIRGVDFAIAEKQLHLAGMDRCPYCDRWFREEYRQGRGRAGACYLCQIGDDAY
jgi:hypothetical protein